MNEILLPNRDDVLNNTIVDAPVTGVATVTAIAAELFAGASRLAGRRYMLIKNEHLALRLRVGPASVTQQSGLPIEPGGACSFSFDPNKEVPIYGISEGDQLEVSVIEY